MLLTALLFGVSWGDPLGAAVVLIAFAAVSAGAAMLLGTLPANAAAATGIGVVLSLALAALGGALLPTELFGEGLQSRDGATPTSWALDAKAETTRHDGSVPAV